MKKIRIIFGMNPSIVLKVYEHNLSDTTGGTRPWSLPMLDVNVFHQVRLTCVIHKVRQSEKSANFNHDSCCDYLAQ